MSEEKEVVEQQEEEEEEEEDLVDPLDTTRESCAQRHCQHYTDLLTSCNERVSSRSQTEEICHEEVMNLFHCMDDCTNTAILNTLK